MANIVLKLFNCFTYYYNNNMVAVQSSFKIYLFYNVSQTIQRNKQNYLLDILKELVTAFYKYMKL